MRKLILASLLCLSSSAALADTPLLSITSTTPTQITKYNGDTSMLSYQLTLTLDPSSPLDLYLNAITPKGTEPSLTLASTTCAFNLQNPPLTPGQSCSVTYTAPVPSLTDPTQAQTYQESFEVLDGLGKTYTSSDFQLVVDPTPPANLVFMQNNTAITSLNFAYNSSGSIVLKNNSDTAASNLQVAIPQAISSAFTSTCTNALPAQGTCTITYNMTNPTQGSYTLSASASNAATKTLALAVSNQSSLVFQKEGSTISSDAFEAGATQNYTVKNIGQDPAQDFSLSVPSDFESFVGGTCLSTTTLAPEASCTVEVNSLEGQAAVSDTLVASASNASPQGNLQLSLEALPALVFQQVSAPGQAIEFANVSETGSLALQVKNNGSRSVTQVSVNAGDLSHAVQSGVHCPIDSSTDTLNAGSTCDLTLNFNGAGIAPGSYTINVTGLDALPSTLTIVLSTLGHFTVLDLSNQVITHASHALTSSDNITLTNTGDTSITDVSITSTSGQVSGSCTSSTTLSPGGTCTLALPSALGVNAFTFSGTDADNNNTVFPVFAYNAWTSTQGPVGAQISALIKDPASGALYAGVYNNGGVFKSTDGGVTWSHTGMQGINREIEDMKQIGTYIYAITLNNDVYVYNTADTTPTWTKIPSGGYAGRALAVDGTTLYAGFGYASSAEVFELTAGSSQWTQISTTGLSSYPQALVVKDHVLYAATASQGVYVYQSGEWTQIGLADSNVTAMAVINSTLYAAVSNQVYEYSSTSNGWQAVGSGAGGGTIYDIQAWNGNLVIGCAYGVFQFDGTNWSQVGLKSLWAYHLLVDGSSLYAASISYVDDGVYKFSPVGGDWQQMITGIYAPLIKDITMGSNALYTADHVGVDQYVAGQTPAWSKVGPNTQPYNVESVYANGAYLYAGTRSGVEQIAQGNPADSWSSVGGPINEWITTLISFNNTLYAGTDADRAYGFLNASWSQVGADFPSDMVQLASLNNTLFAADYSSGVYSWNGSAWDLLSTTGLPTNKTIKGLVVHDGQLYLSNYYGLYVWNPTLNAWTSVPNSPEHLIGVCDVNGLLYAMTNQYGEESIYRYDDTYHVWYLMNEGVPADLYGKDLVGDANTLYLDSNGLGIFKSSLT